MFQVAIRLFGGTLLLRMHVNTEAGYSAANKTRISIRAAKLVSGFFFSFFRSGSLNSHFHYLSPLCSGGDQRCGAHQCIEAVHSIGVPSCVAVGTTALARDRVRTGWRTFGTAAELRLTQGWSLLKWIEMGQLYKCGRYTMIRDTQWHTHILYLDCACRISFEMTLPGLQELRKTRLSIRLTLPCWRCLAS